MNSKSLFYQATKEAQCRLAALKDLKQKAIIDKHEAQVKLDILEAIEKNRTYIEYACSEVEGGQEKYLLWLCTREWFAGFKASATQGYRNMITITFQ